MSSRRIRVAQIITKLDVGGAQLTVLDLCRGLDPQRFDVTVFSGVDEGSGGDLGPEFDAAGIPVVAVRSMGRSIRGSDGSAVRELAGQLRAFGPDIVQTHSSKAGVLGRLAAHRVGVPVVIHTVHGWSFRSTQPLPLRRGAALLERFLARWTDRLFVVTDVDRQIGLANGIGTAAKYRVVRSGIDLADGGSDRDAARAELDLAPDDFAVGWVGRYDPLKDPETLVRTIAATIERLPATTFFLVGSGPLEQATRDGLADAGLTDHVELLGRRSDARALMPGFDVMLLTSKAEGMPRVVIEGLAAGVPVVSTDVGGVGEVVVDGVTGWLAAPSDADGLAAGIERCAAGRPARPIDVDLSGFSTQAMVAACEAAYASALGAELGSDATTGLR